MSERSLPAFWWNDVAGPRGFLDEVVDALLSRESVVLTLPDDLAWRHEMRNAFRDLMETTPGLAGLFLEVADVSEDGSGMGPAEFLLERFVLEEDRLRFRPARQTPQQYLLEHGLLAERVVWVKGIGRGETLAWTSFLADWHPRSVSDGLFVIEDREGARVGMPAVRQVDYASQVDETSVRLFCWNVFAGERYRGLGTLWRKYAVALLANLCEGDVEVALAMAEALDLMRDDPVEVVCELARSSRFARRGNPGSNHVLALAREGRKDKLEGRLWEAQVETLFPLIERERSKVVRSLEGELWDRIEHGGIVQFGRAVESPLDVEFGSLVHLMGADEGGDREPLCLDRRTRDRVFLLWRCRNLLAHRNACAPDQVSALLDGVDAGS